MRYTNGFLLSLFVFGNAFAIGVNLDEAKTIKSDKVEYNIKSEEIKTHGNTEITNVSGQRIKLNNASLSKSKSDVYADDIELWLGSNVYIKADKITRNENDTFAEHAIFTACDGCDSFGTAWEISSNEIIHDFDDKMLYFHNSAFWIYNGNIPILWLPYYEMPDPSVKYKSGLLTPSFNSTNAMGTQINLPIYINISDHHDLTTTFSYLTQENPLFQIEHRLNAKHSQFRTNASFTHNKEAENRWYVQNNDEFELGNNARAYVYVQRTSDKTYLQKYGFYDYQPYLDSGAKLELFGQTSYIVADTHIFQELRQPTGNQTISSGNILPNIRGTYQTNPLFSETYLTLSGDILGVSASHTSNQRVVGIASIVSPWTLWGGTRLTASVSSRYDLYNFENTKIHDGDNIIDSYSGVKTRFLPSGYVELGLPLFDVKNDWTYVLEPRARLTIMEHTKSKSVFSFDNDSAGRFLSDTTLFAKDRFSGLDVWGNGNFMDYGARWAAFNQNHNIEVFLGQTYDFYKNDIPDDFNENGFRNGLSDYVGRVTYTNQDLFQITTRFRFDRKDMAINHVENSVYTKYNSAYLSLGHIWDSKPIDIYSENNKDTHEIVGEIGFPLTKRIYLSGSTFYNAYEHVFQRHAGGIFYNHPCYYFALEYRHDNAIKDDYIGGTTYQFKFGISIDGKHY